MNDFSDLIDKIAAQGDSWSILEYFKSRFIGGSGTSSDEGWARTDLYNALLRARSNAPAFIDALWAGIADLSRSQPTLGLPNEHNLNAILAARGEPYEIRPPQLLSRNVFGAPVVSIPQASLDETARRVIQSSLDRADELLVQQHPRQAVQEILWLLETVSTAFDGRETGGSTIEGKYFNSIVRELIKLGNGGLLAEATKWISKLHGYLSSPSGGGIRHGTHLNTLVQIEQHEARLYCNLTKSYIDFLLAEAARMPPAVKFGASVAASAHK